jgi:hypothetical protein
MIPDVFLIILAILLLVFSYLLFSPIELRISVIIDEAVSAVSAISIYPFRYRLFPRPQKSDKTRKPERAGEKEAPKPKEKPGRRGQLDFSAFDFSDVRRGLVITRKMLTTVRRLAKSPEYFLAADLKGGTEEPDLTGMIYGAYHAIRPNLPGSVRIRYAPDYVIGRITGDISFGMKVAAFIIIQQLAISIIRMPIIEIVKLYRKARKGGKHGK